MCKSLLGLEGALDAHPLVSRPWVAGAFPRAACQTDSLTHNFVPLILSPAVGQHVLTLRLHFAWIPLTISCFNFTQPFPATVCRSWPCVYNLSQFAIFVVVLQFVKLRYIWLHSAENLQLCAIFGKDLQHFAALQLSSLLYAVGETPLTSKISGFPQDWLRM